MLKRLVLLWHKITAWLVPGPTVTTHHGSHVSEPYQPSNLHARHFR